jgi:hypothetical protein
MFTQLPADRGRSAYNDVPPPDEIKKRLWRLDSGLNELRVCWQHLTTLPGQPWFLKPDPFESDQLLPLNVTTIGPPSCPDWQHRCRSGPYTILLKVTDTTGKDYYDTQQVWFDNKTMNTNVQVLFHGLEGLPSCQDLHLNPNQPFIPPGAPCNVAWPVNLLGIAYDEYINEFDTSYPSDNFDFYSLSITKQTGEVLNVPITISPSPTNPLIGTIRRGQPGVRCEPLPAGGAGCKPAEVVPGQAFDVLTALDMRVFDAVCAPSLPNPRTPFRQRSRCSAELAAVTRSSCTRKTRHGATAGLVAFTMPGHYLGLFVSAMICRPREGKPGGNWRAA